MGPMSLPIDINAAQDLHVGWRVAERRIIIVDIYFFTLHVFLIFHFVFLHF